MAFTGGQVPGMTPLSIGGVTFNSSEAPERLPIGAVEQMVVTKTLPGGTRVVAAFGPSAKTVSWSGKFFDVFVGPRIRQLRLYAVSGQPQTLVYNNEAYFCVVKEFTPTYMAGYAEYEITVEIVSAQNGALAVASPVTIDQQISALNDQANNANNTIVAADPTGSAVYQAQLTNAQSQIQQNTPIAQNVVSAALYAVPAIQSAIAAISGYGAGLSSSGTLFANVTTLIASLTAISANISRGQSATSTTIQGGSLFGLAALHYGDVTQAFTLATANGLISPFISGAQQTLVTLPPLLGK